MKFNLNQITIQVKDVEKSIAFYEKLGLRLIVCALPHYARFECVSGATTFSLHQLDPDALPASNTWIYFETENLDEDVQKLIAEGFEIEEMPEDKPWLWREARLKDLDGHQLILYYAGNNRLYPPWRVEN